MNLFQMALRGGILMGILLIISIVAFAIIIERFIKLKKAKNGEQDFLKEVKTYLSENQTEQALRLCEIRSENPIANVIYKGLQASDVGYNETQQAVETAANSEMHKLEKNLGTLSTFAAISPLIGFLGTVTGMVKVFMNISQTGGGVDISLLASGIYEALVTTIGGLTVGIIAILFYNYLVGKIEDIGNDLQEDSNEFLLNLRKTK